MKNVIEAHAKKHLGNKGRVQVKGGRRVRDGIYEATVILTKHDCTEYYHGMAGHGAVALTLTRTTPRTVADMPLFQQPHA